jgi:hypothetical protein
MEGLSWRDWTRRQGFEPIARNDGCKKGDHWSEGSARVRDVKKTKRGEPTFDELGMVVKQDGREQGESEGDHQEHVWKDHSKRNGKRSVSFYAVGWHDLVP